GGGGTGGRGGGGRGGAASRVPSANQGGSPGGDGDCRQPASKATTSPRHTPPPSQRAPRMPEPPRGEKSSPAGITLHQAAPGNKNRPDSARTGRPRRFQRGLPGWQWCLCSGRNLNPGAVMTRLEHQKSVALGPRPRDTEVYFGQRLSGKRKGSFSQEEGGMGQPTPEAGLELEHFRDYLRLLAQLQIPARLRARLDASDLVQIALLKAHQSAEDFR